MGCEIPLGSVSNSHLAILFSFPLKGTSYRLMERGANQRATSSTRLNELSSRSHAVFMLIAEQSEIVPSDNMDGI